MAAPLRPAPSALPDADALAGASISIGITGHRLDRLDPADGENLPTLLASLFDTIAAAAKTSSVRLVTGLADGVDSMAALAAIDRGWPVDAILPFARDVYATDFAEGAPTEQFGHLLAQSDRVMELDGVRDDPHGSSIAYERAGRVLLAQCDVLIAVWDGGPVRGRGGAAQIVHEAIQHEVPVIWIDPSARAEPAVLWDGLARIAHGPDTIDTIARGTLATLPDLFGALVLPPVAVDEAGLPGPAAANRSGRTWAIAYPLLLAACGVRRLRKADFTAGASPASADAIAALCCHDEPLGGRLGRLLAPRFIRADAVASHCAQLFRHSYVANFVLSALAVLLALAGLALPAAIKPLLIALEIAIIASILIRTRRGNRAGWHAIWLEQRALAERLRCLAVTARVGDLNLRGATRANAGQSLNGWVAWYARATAREIGLPAVAVDAAYLATLRAAMLRLIDGELGYLDGETRQMHALDHRLHRLGTWLFAATALSCIALLAYKLAAAMQPPLEAISGAVAIGAAIAGAALPAFGAAIYGIRMQGDFAATAQRGADLSGKLAALRQVIDRDPPDFDTLSRHARSITSLLTTDVAIWSHSTGARPLTLPG